MGDLFRRLEAVWSPFYNPAISLLIVQLAVNGGASD